LLVEDNAEYRDSFKYAFPDEPFQLIEAPSPEEAVRILETHPALRVILLDLDFEKSAGKSALVPAVLDYTVLNYVKQQGNRHRVVVLTAYEELLAAGLAEEYEVFNYLPKSGKLQAVRFSLDQAFKELDRDHLVQKNKYLLDVQKKISSNAPLSEILDFICSAVRTTVGAYNCHIRVYDFGRGDFRLEGFAGADESLRKLFASPRAKGHFFSGEVVQTGIANTFGNLQKLKRFLDYAAEVLQQELTAPQLQYLKTVESAHIAPIMTGLFQPGVDAVLNVSSAELDFFDKSKQDTIDEFVTQAELAIAKNWLQMKRDEVLQDYNEISQMLADISDSLRGPDPKAAICEIAVRRIAKIINPEVMSVFLFDKSSGTLNNVAELGGDDSPHEPNQVFAPGQSLTGWVYAENQTVQIPEWGDPNKPRPTDDKRFDNEKVEVYRGQIPSRRIEHYLAVPIQTGGDCRGVLRAVNKKSEYYTRESAATDPACLLDRGFSNDCRNAMEIAASHLAVAIRNAELLQQKERQIEQIRTMGDVGRLIASASDIKEVMKVTIQKVAAVMKAEICMLFLKSDDGEHLVLKEQHGLPDNLLPNAFYKMGEGETGTVAATGVAKLLPHRKNGKYDEEILGYLRKKHGPSTDIESVMIVAIRAGETTLGVMKVINKEGHIEYSQQDLEWFQTLAAYVGVAIDNTRAVIQKRNAALSVLVSAVAHEINNTCGLIQVNVAGARNQLSPGVKMLRRLNLIERLATQATDFANEIAGFGAGRRGERQTIDINAVIRSTVEDLQGHPKYGDSENFRVELHPSSEPLLCRVFKNPFIQIVRNIFINANQALENSVPGVLRISTVAGVGFEIGTAVLRFEDNGPGIRPDHMRRIFDPDFTTKPAGNGIGLWLVKTQLEQIGGTIRAYSDVGKGASFVITVPLATSGATSGAAA
jgi:signal transduction histidine kinase/CheY-like chemotaxis protein